MLRIVSCVTEFSTRARCRASSITAVWLTRIAQPRGPKPSPLGCGRKSLYPYKLLLFVQDEKRTGMQPVLTAKNKGAREGESCAAAHARVCGRDSGTNGGWASEVHPRGM